MMYVELQLSAQDVTELQRKQDVRAVNSNTSRTDTPPTSQTLASVPGSSLLSQFSPQRPRARFNSTHCASLPESGSPTQTCYHQFCPSLSSPGRPLASVCPHHSCLQQSGCSPSSSSPESPIPASAIEEVCCVSSFIKSNNTHRLTISASALFFLLSDPQTSSAQKQIQRPGAVIESFVSHSPGFYSGTFSGERAPSQITKVDTLDL